MFGAIGQIKEKLVYLNWFRHRITLRRRSRAREIRKDFFHLSFHILWLGLYVSSKIVSVTVLDSRLSFFEPHLLWAYLFISLVRSSRCIMIWNQFWGSQNERRCQEKRGKINQIRLESGFFYFVFRKTFLKITWPRLINGLDAIQEILEV